MRLLATCTAVCIAISGALLLVFVMDPPVRKVSGSVLAAPVTSALPQSPPVFINEIHYDNIGPDEYELVEIAGPAGTDLTGWQLLLYDGTGGAPYGSYALSGTLLDQQHGTGVLVFNILGIQDGTPDGLALLDPNGTVLQFLSYEGTFSATEGPASGLSSEDIGVAEPGAIGKSLQLTGEGCTYGDFSWTGPLDSSAGQPNDGQAFQCSESTPSDAAPAVLQTSPVDGAEDVAVNAAIVVTFSEPVSLSTVAFILTDSTGLTTTPSINGQDRVYTATLQTSIGHGTAYTLTVLSSAVHDLDTQDPPDVLPSDYILNFQTSPLKSGWIVNEIHADPSPEHGDANADGRVDMVEDEFIEIANYTGQAVDISGWTVSIAGADALDVHHVFPAGLVVPDRCAVVVFGGGTAYGSFGGAVPQVAYTPGGDSLSLNDTQGTVSLFDGSSVIASVAYGSEAGDDQSLTLSPDVTGTLPLVVHSSAAGAAGRLSSPGTLTDGTRFPGCPILVPIYAVQGTGDSSPFEGTYTTVEGVVTGDFQQQDDDTDHNLAGFYIQQLIGDGDPGTSDGIFVSDGPIPLLDITVGDWLRVSGTVEEVNGETRLQAAAISRVGTALSPQPVEFSLPVSTIRLDAGAPPTASLIADLEPVEGMWIRVLNPLTVASLDTSDEYGDFKVRPLSTPHDLAGQFTQYNLPNLAGFADHLADVARHTLTVDGGRDAGPLSINNPDGTSGSINLLRLGNVVTGLVGTVRFSSGSEGHGDGTYRLVPTQPPVLTVHNSRPVTPPRLKSRLRLAAVNLDAYFTTLATEGAGDADEFERQTQKLVTTLAELEADVYTLTGLEDNYAADESSALAILTNHLNQRVSSAGETDLFAYIDPGQNLVEYAANPSSAVGIMYRPSVLSPDAGLAVAILSNEQLPALELHGSTFSGDAGNRPAMAATFVENSTGERFTLVVAHFKSRDDGPGGNDAFDGQGPFNQVRIDGAEALRRWLLTDPTDSHDPDFLLVGDLNAYAQEDPILLLDTHFDNLVKRFVGSDGYTTRVGGQQGVLDWAYASPSLSPQVSGLDIWHINADEADALGYDGLESAFDAAFPYRSASRDPVLVGLTLASPDLALTMNVTPSVGLPGMPVTYTLDLRNRGTFTATSVVLTHTVPAALIEVAVSGAGAAITQGSVSPLLQWTFAGLAPQTRHVITVTGMLRDDKDLYGATIESQARVRSAWNPAGSEAGATLSVPSAPELLLQNVTSASAVDEGQIVVVTSTVTNVGASPASEVSVANSTAGVLAQGISLAPGAGAAYRYTVAALDGPATLVNTTAVSSRHTQPFTDQTELMVANVPPIVMATEAGSALVGQAVTITTLFTDPGQDTFRASIDWGDGAVSTSQPASYSFDGTHVYHTAGNFLLRACVVDDDGGQHCRQANLTIHPLPTAPPVKTVTPTLAPDTTSTPTPTPTATQDRPPPENTEPPTPMPTTTSPVDPTATPLTSTPTQQPEPLLAISDSYQVDEDNSILIRPLENDLCVECVSTGRNSLDYGTHASTGNTLELARVDQPVYGTVTDLGNGLLRYIPASNFYGADHFRYVARNPVGETGAATVHLKVMAVNDPPTAVDDVSFLKAGEEAVIRPLDNDFDVDTDGHQSAELSLVHVGEPSAGAIIAVADGSIRYRSPPAFTGTARFTYTVADATATNGHPTGQGRVTVAVRNPDDTAVAAIQPIADHAVTFEDQPILIQVLGNDILTASAPGNAETLASPATLVSLQQPLYGRATISGTEVLYRAGQDYTGMDHFTYAAGYRDSVSSAPVTVTVHPLNDAPFAGDDTVRTSRDQPILVPILANDRDPEGRSLAIVGTTAPRRGKVTVTGPHLRYVPAAGYVGRDSFAYTVADDDGAADWAVVFAQVTLHDTPPVARDDTATVLQNDRGYLNVLNNDLDPDAGIPGTDLTVAALTDAAYGEVALGPRDTVVYTPDLDYVGPDRFTYTVVDDSGHDDIATVLIQVQSVPAPPAAQNDAVILFTNHVQGASELPAPTVSEDANSTSGTSIFALPSTSASEDGISVDADVAVVYGSVVSIDPIANDYSTDGQPLQLVSIGDDTNGVVRLHDDGTISYTPHRDFHGTVRIPYEVASVARPDLKASGLILVLVDPTPGNLKAVDDTATVTSDELHTLDLLANDEIDGGSILLGLTPALGQTWMNVDNTISYRPPRAFSGTDTFQYVIGDQPEGTPGTGAASRGDAATVTVHVNRTNRVPIPWPDYAATNEEVAVPLDLLHNDRDPDGDPLTLVATGPPRHGTLSVSDGKVRYIPDRDFSGQDRFVYYVADTSGDSARAVVRLEVQPVNDPPTAAPDLVATEEEVPLSIQPLANDDDPDGDALSLLLLNGPDHGTLIQQDGGNLLYEPADDFHGADTFQYQVQDGQEGRDTGEVTITVIAANDPPVLFQLPDQSNPAGSSVTLPLHATDVDGDRLVFQARGLPAGLHIDPEAGVIQGSPDSRDQGIHAVTIEVTDGRSRHSRHLQWTISQDVVGSPGETSGANRLYLPIIMY